MDTFDYQRSSVPARMPAQRASSLSPQRYDGHSQDHVPSPLSVKAVLRASRRYWWLILALWTVGSAGIGAAVYVRIKPQYRASSWLEVVPTAIDLYGVANHEGVEPYMQTHVTLIKSPTVLSAAKEVPTVLKWPRIQNAVDPVNELGKSIQVGIQAGTHIIEVAMISNDAKEAADLVNAVVDEFLTQNRTWSNSATQKQIDKLTTYSKTLDADIQRILKDLRERVARSSEPLKLTAIKPPKSASSGDGDEKDKDGNGAKDEKGEKGFNWTVDNYQKMLAECSDIKFQLLQAETNYDEARRNAEEASRAAKLGGTKPRNSAQIEQRINSDPDIVAMMQRIKAASDKARQIGINTRHSGDPAERQARDQANRLTAEFQTAVERKKQQFMADMGSGDPQLEMERTEKVVRDLNKRKMLLEKELSDTKIETTKRQSEEFEYQLLMQDYHELDNMSRLIHKKLEQLTFDSSQEEKIRLRNPAREENLPIADKRFQYMAMAPLGVLGAVLGLVVLLELRSGRVADTDILSSRMKHEVFAIAPLPNVRAGIGQGGDRAEQRLARFVQSLDHLRVALCEGGSNGEGRCVMITSATGGEGKTTLSAHLAARCANAGTSTLLIDADLRRASLGRLLDVPNGLGLGDVLAGSTELEGALISVQAGGFHFLSAGTPGIDPTRVLKSARLAELIGQLRQMYDLIIIDTPPVLPVADALIMGRWADGAVMASRYDASRLPLVERANRQIIAAGIPVLGVVVNGMKGQDQAYGNYAYNYSYPGRQEPLNDPANPS